MDREMPTLLPQIPAVTASPSVVPNAEEDCSKAYFFIRHYGTQICPECAHCFSWENRAWQPVQEGCCTHVKCRTCFMANPSACLQCYRLQYPEAGNVGSGRILRSRKRSIMPPPSSFEPPQNSCLNDSSQKITSTNTVSLTPNLDTCSKDQQSHKRPKTDSDLSKMKTLEESKHAKIATQQQTGGREQKDTFTNKLPKMLRVQDLPRIVTTVNRMGNKPLPALIKLDDQFRPILPQRSVTRRTGSDCHYKGTLVDFPSKEIDFHQTDLSTRARSIPVAPAPSLHKMTDLTNQSNSAPACRLQMDTPSDIPVVSKNLPRQVHNNDKIAEKPNDALVEAAKAIAAVGEIARLQREKQRLAYYNAQDRQRRIILGERN